MVFFASLDFFSQEYVPAPRSVQDMASARVDDISGFYKPLTAGFGLKSVPVIDMAALANGDVDGKVSKDIVQACKDCGVLVATNHGIPNELVKKVKDLAMAYFEMPTEDRATDWGAFVWPKSGARLWLDSLAHFIKPPTPDLVPRSKLPEGYRSAINDYGNEVLKLTRAVKRVLSEGLGLGPTCFETALGEEDAAMRVNYYPPCPKPEMVTGLTRHTDANNMTVLLQNDVEGLQVSRGGDWVTVPVIPNSIIILIGDQIQMLSNGAYASCEHRAFVNNHSARLSIALFDHPNPGHTIAPLPELVDEEHPALYKPVTFREYLAVFKGVGLDESDGKLPLKEQEIRAVKTEQKDHYFIGSAAAADAAQPVAVC